MRAHAIEIPEAFRSRHCSTEEYDAFLASCDYGKDIVQQRRSHRKLFVQAWPDLEEWLHAPLAVGVGRTIGETRKTLRNPTSYRARAYLYYLALKGYLRIDFDWLLAVNDLCIHDTARHMRIDFGVETHAREGAALGLRHANADRAMRWLYVKRTSHGTDGERGRGPCSGLGLRATIMPHWGELELLVDDQWAC
jgi:hypothetical protein